MQIADVRCIFSLNIYGYITRASIHNNLQVAHTLTHVHVETKEFSSLHIQIIKNYYSKMNRKNFFNSS